MYYFSTPKAPNMGNNPPKMGKNEYSNYDDHCTVVVVIQYAFLKKGFGGVVKRFLARLLQLAVCSLAPSMLKV